MGRCLAKGEEKPQIYLELRRASGIEFCCTAERTGDAIPGCRNLSSMIPSSLCVCVAKYNLTSNQKFLSIDGRFCLSDDSHGVAQVGAKYHEILDYIQEQGIKNLYFLELAPVGISRGLDPRFPRTLVKYRSLAEVKEMDFWKR